MLSLEEAEGMGSSGWKDRELGCYQWSRCENGCRSQILGLEAESGSCSRNQGVCVRGMATKVGSVSS